MELFATLLLLWPWLPAQMALLRPWLGIRGRALWNSLWTDLRAARRNLKNILHSPPHGVLLLLALWPILWGINALRVGDALWSTAPSVYAWMHVLPWLHAGVWGVFMIALGLWQIRALVWPSARRLQAMRVAVRVLCGTNTGMAVAFLLSAPLSSGFSLYGLLAAASIWCLWRLSGAGE